MNNDIQLLKGVIFDWAGTMVDYGSRAPVAVFIELFRRYGVDITISQARAPMGLEKLDHIRIVLAMPPIAEQWETRYGRAWTDEDAQAMYRDSVALQVETVLQYADLIPGAVEVADYCRARGMKIGATTGYNRPIMEKLLPLAAAQGYAPDLSLCPSDVSAGRPAPWMAFHIAEQFGIYPMSAFVKIGDTVVDIKEGKNAGMWTIALAQSGNMLGFSLSEVNALAPDALEARLVPIRERLYGAGAHYVVNTIAEIPEILEAITVRMQAGERP
jgi:phosphonoacetaldehyde hydrolase